MDGRIKYETNARKYSGPMTRTIYPQSHLSKTFEIPSNPLIKANH